LLPYLPSTEETAVRVFRDNVILLVRFEINVKIAKKPEGQPSGLYLVLDQTLKLKK